MRAIDVQRTASTFGNPLKINPHQPVNQDKIRRADWEPALRAITVSDSTEDGTRPCRSPPCGRSMFKDPPLVSATH